MSIVEDYIKAHETAWSPATLKSERSRLKIFCATETPEELYQRASAVLKPYALKTLFIRVSHMEEWAQAQWGYKKFMKTHRNRFKYVYDRKEVGVSYADACRAIGEIKEERAAALAHDLLATGLRISEAYRVNDGLVTGKGGKTRRVYGTIRAGVPAQQLRAQLKAVGLKPHDLRKLCATRLAERGATAADLCKVLGWSSIQTAYRYLQPLEDSKLRALVEEASKGP